MNSLKYNKYGMNMKCMIIGDREDYWYRNWDLIKEEWNRDEI